MNRAANRPPDAGPDAARDRAAVPAAAGDPPRTAPPASSARPTDSLREFIAAQTTLALATLNADGTPQACDVFYAYAEDWTFYFLSDPKTAHIRNLEREPRTGATIHGEAHGWQEIRGVQMAGTARRVSHPADRARGYARYIARYAFVGQWLTSVAALGQWHKHLGTVEMYAFTPHWVRWVDNTQGLGHKQEWIPGDA